MKHQRKLTERWSCVRESVSVMCMRLSVYIYIYIYIYIYMDCAWINATSEEVYRDVIISVCVCVCVCEREHVCVCVSVCVKRWNMGRVIIYVCSYVCVCAYRLNVNRWDIIRSWLRGGDVYTHIHASLHTRISCIHTLCFLVVALVVFTKFVYIFVIWDGALNYDWLSTSKTRREDLSLDILNLKIVSLPLTLTVGF